MTASHPHTHSNGVTSHSNGIHTHATQQQQQNGIHTHSKDTTAASAQQEQQHDAEQLKLMAEECLLVDTHDRIIGHASKKQCHLIPPHSTADNPDRHVPLHRAFSVFLFNSKGELLLQKRAPVKITFPSLWTNTCCSHPLHHIEQEWQHSDDPMNDDSAALLAAQGVKYAAIRKLEHELGIAADQLKIDDFHFLTKIHYGAHNYSGSTASDSSVNGSSSSNSSQIWGEHEIDWILFIEKDVTLQCNENEVSGVKYVTEDELKRMIDEGVDNDGNKVKLTPWFALIAKQFLFPWWQQLSEIIENDGLPVNRVEARKTIHRLGGVKA